MGRAISYTVIVMDMYTKKETLKLPCAEKVTAQLVQKNMKKLFPAAIIELREAIPQNAIFSTSSFEQESSKVYSIKSESLHLVQNSEDELERDLFEDVA